MHCVSHSESAREVGSEVKERLDLRDYPMPLTVRFSIQTSAYRRETSPNSVVMNPSIVPAT